MGGPVWDQARRAQAGIDTGQGKRADPPSVPAPTRGCRALSNGTLQWSLRPRIGVVDARIEFVRSPATASKTIAFVQTLTQADTSPGLLGTGIFSTTAIGNTQVDALRHERDPFYGAQWNAAGTRKAPCSTTHRSWKSASRSNSKRPQ